MPTCAQALPFSPTGVLLGAQLLRLLNFVENQQFATVAAPLPLPTSNTQGGTLPAHPVTVHWVMAVPVNSRPPHLSAPGR